MTFGTVTLAHGLMLAPMAGFTDTAMRQVCFAHGAEYAVTEMISAKAVVYSDRKTLALAKIASGEGPVALQLFGSEPAILAEAAARLYDALAGARPVAFDINMGCPVPKIYGNGEGSALMKNPDLIGKIVEAVRLASPLPVTVKLRAGVDEAHRNAVDCARTAEAAGASLVVIHGRTRTEMYRGRADREIMQKVKESLHIPVIANGDVASGADALALLSETGADGIAIGRAAVGNPFLFTEIAAALDGTPFTPPTLDERIAAAKEQLRLAVLDKGECVAVKECRKQIALYLSGFRGAAALRDAVNRAATERQVCAALDATQTAGF